LPSHEAISVIRRKAELARRLSSETGDPEAKAALLKIASQLNADADRLELSVRRFTEGGK
jgi:hypothetical protein